MFVDALGNDLTLWKQSLKRHFADKQKPHQISKDW